ncbi:MAG: PP2C family protein-serine/threonine phosphatase [Acidimicrobiales bacterium]
MTTLRSGAATDVGRVREINEDRFLDDDTLFAVADGVGGHQAGEIASATSVHTLREAFRDQTAAGLARAVMEANQAVWHLAQQRPDRRGMGTTLSALALVVDDGDERLAVANVGDSRVYLLSGDHFGPLTEDDSLVAEMVREGRISPAEALVHPQRSIITRALGMDPDLLVDVGCIVAPRTGDRFLLCSDGLTNELSEERIAAALRRLEDPADVARDLVRQARAEGGADNITVVVVDVVTAPEVGAFGPTMTVPLAGNPVASGDLGALPGESSLAADRPFPPTPAPAPGSMQERTGRRAASAYSYPPDPGPAPLVARRPLLTWRTGLFVVLVLAVLGVAAAAVVGANRTEGRPPATTVPSEVTVTSRPEVTTTSRLDTTTITSFGSGPTSTVPAVPPAFGPGSP